MFVHQLQQTSRIAIELLDDCSHMACFISKHGRVQILVKDGHCKYTPDRFGSLTEHTSTPSWEVSGNHHHIRMLVSHSVIGYS